MRRVLIITFSALGVLAVVLITGLYALFHTEAGRRFIIARAEPELSDALGTDVAIGGLSGRLPNHLILTDVTFSDEAGPWMTIARAELDWRPVLLFDDRVDIDRLAVENAHMLRRPPSGDDEEDDGEPVELKLPDNLPKIRIGDLSVTDFRSELGSAPARLDGVGALDMGGRLLNARIDVTSQDDKDNADVIVEINPESDWLFIDATIAAKRDGVIAAFAGLDGPLFLHAKNDSPTNAADIAVSGVIADYGMLEGKLSGNLAHVDKLNVTARFTPGDALSSVDELAAPASLSAIIDDNPKGARFTITQSTSAIGHVTGDIEWTIGRKGADTINANLSAKFDEAYRPDIQKYLGPAADATVKLKRRRSDYDVNMKIIGDGVGLTLSDGKTDFDTTLSGDLLATFEPRKDISFLYAKAVLTGGLNIVFDDKATLNGLVLKYDDGSSAGGSFSYSFDDDELRFDGDIEASPALIAHFVPSLKARDFVTGIVQLAGPPDMFTLKIELDTPAIAVGGDEAPPLKIDAAFAGLPDLPNGDITARAAKGEGRFNATLRSSEAETISIPMLGYAGKGFQLAGDGVIHPQAETVEINLDYKGEAGAEPWPGVMLAGGMKIDGTFSHAGSQTNIKATADAVRFKDFAVSGLALEASGPTDALAVKARAAAVSTPQTGAVKEISATANVDMRDVVKVSLTAFDALFGDNAASLRQPATISFEDGVSVDRLRLNWGRRGRIALDGAFSDQRWRADLGLTDVNVPGADGRITLNLDLDTDKPAPARGAFELRSLLTQEPTATLKGKVSWDGQNVLVTSAKDDDPIDMRLTLPVILNRTSSLSVETSGKLDGYARYDGQVDVIAAYLPPVLQTLEGKLKADVTVGGTTKDPEISGRADLTGGAYTELQTGLSLAGLHTEATASYAGENSVIRFSGGARGDGQSGEDTITIDGDITIGDASSLDLALKLKNAKLSAHPVDTVRANGEIDIKGPLDAIKAGGAVSIEELDAEIVTPENTGLVPIDIVAYNGQTGVETAIAEKPKLNVDYDLTITADDRIFIRGRGVDSEWSANVKIENGQESPRFVGAMNLRRGTLDFSGRRFQLTKGVITFDRLSENNPLLDIQAELDTADGVTAVISITGRADAPVIELQSTPSMPSEDVMALILFGKSADELTALESLQTAEALASLSGIGPFGGAGVTGSIRRAIGLDMLNFDIDPENGGGSLTIGKYVAEGFFVSATQDAQGEEGAVRLEYEITDSISVETEVRQDGDQTVSANWKKDF